jgi:RNA polymerase sigma-70 factor (ECF subfamily)
MEAGALGRPLWIQTDEHSIRERAVDHKRSLSGQSDEELVELCKQHDHEAFTVLVDRYKNRIHWMVRRMVGGLEDEDFTQEVFLRVYQAFPSFRSGSKFSTWIYKIAHNLCLSELRKRKRRGEHVSMEEEGEEKVHWLLRESGEDLEEQIERRDFSRNVQALVEKLPTPHRTALTLFYVNQVRYEEIAEIMNIPMGTVKTYIHRARARLRDLILAEPEMVDLVGESATDMTGTGGQSG